MGYSSEIQILIVLAHLKARGIRKVIASPGTTNMNFVLSCQNDPFFQVYSSVDERSASYMAVGLSYESGEPVVLSCTGATASRNYLPGVTEAYYRNLPIIAITSSQKLTRVGKSVAQVLDRSIQPNDTYKFKFVMDTINNQEDTIHYNNELNNLYLQIIMDPGPININLVTSYSNDFSINRLPPITLTKFILDIDLMPDMDKDKIAIHIKSGIKLGTGVNKLIDEFCEKFDAIVIGDHTCSYQGKYKVLNSLVTSQPQLKNELIPNLILEIGDITGDYSISSVYKKDTKIWRIENNFKKIKSINEIENYFLISINSFLQYYIKINKNSHNANNESYLELWKNEINRLYEMISDLPFSNIWVAKKMHSLLPNNSSLHLGILNSLRSWNFFEIDNSVQAISNVGGFGIDGNLSSLIGASLSSPNKLFYGIFGDLAFFYDLNSLGNREIKNNLRIILINNGTGTEFKNFNHRASNFDSDNFVAAKGHFGNKSPNLVKNYSENLGFQYYGCHTKIDFEVILNTLMSSTLGVKSIIIELFINESDESLALEVITKLIKPKASSSAKELAIKAIGVENKERVKRLLGR